MPQICKARIVNFHYNNGHRLIPDLCFSFEGEDRKAMDTLISLTNGGGKSVIVQMLLQPILPRVRLDQRRVESYFTRPTDYSFILLEWSLENSTHRLMTGIAISGRGGEEDDQRGRTVRYYTFMARYGERGDPEDLVNLPLSTRKKREFRVVPFDYVKEQARKQSSRLSWFREDRQADYRRKLNSYGISTDEWRNVIAEINQREGGLSNFFERFKTGGRLIDDLLLPCVEKKLKTGAPEGEDSSLETLLLNFARDYASVEKQVRERDRAVELEQELKECSEELQPVHAQCERCEELEGQIRGFVGEIRRLRQEQQHRQERSAGALAECAEQERQINQERSADRYYQAEDECEAACDLLETARESWEQSGTAVEQLRHRITVLECARLYEQLSQMEGDMTALQKQLRALEGDTDLKEQVEQLLRRSFRPEFLNRLDEIVFYKPLTKENITKIIDLQIADLNGRLADKQLTCSMSDAAKALIIEAAYDPQYGARPLRRYVQHTVETMLSKRLLRGEVLPGQTVTVDAQDGELIFQ